MNEFVHTHKPAAGQVVPWHAPAPYAIGKRPLRFACVITRASIETGVKVSEIRGASRSYHLCRPRWAVMAAMHRAGWSTPQIGHMLGGRDHTTVLHGIKRARELERTDARFAALLDAVARA